MVLLCFPFPSNKKQVINPPTFRQVTVNINGSDTCTTIMNGYRNLSKWFRQ